jgi:hypothetical protein
MADSIEATSRWIYARRYMGGPSVHRRCISPRRKAWEVSCDGFHLLFRQIARHVAHLFVRALARLKRVQLIEEIRRILASKNRHFAISRDPVGAVAGHAARDRFRSHLLRPRGGGSEDGGEEDGDLHTKLPVTWIAYKHFGGM